MFIRLNEISGLHDNSLPNEHSQTSKKFNGNEETKYISDQSGLNKIFQRLTKASSTWSDIYWKTEFRKLVKRIEACQNLLEHGKAKERKQARTILNKIHRELKKKYKLGIEIGKFHNVRVPPYANGKIPTIQINHIFENYTLTIEVDINGTINRNYKV